MPQEPRLPAGVQIRSLTSYPDARGVFTEVYRAQWPTGIVPVQWNAVGSRAGVLRGVHVHVVHDDYLLLLHGRAIIGLRDLREGSPTQGWATVVEMDGRRQTALTIPHGVAHGFYFLKPSLHLYAVSHYWNVADELGCHWADPDLQIPWPAIPRYVSARDATAGSLKALRAQLAPWQPLARAA